MPELTSFADAQTTIKRLFKVKSGLDESYLDDYARIAWFLTQNGVFETALEQLSAVLWDKYRECQDKFPGRQKNIFTTALREYAASQGWQFGSNIDVLLVGAVSPDQYKTWVTDGLFFKDDMDLKHGEHSHTFQWLAVTMQRATLGLQHAPHDLYKKTFDMMVKGSPAIGLPSFKKAEDFSLWGFVADCFPTSMAPGQVMPQGDSLFSDTYRTPQIIMKFLLDTAKDDHFIAAYLRNRYKRRSWFDTTVNPKYDNVSGGATVKNLAVQKHGNAPGWTAVQGNSGPAAFTQVAGPHFRKDAKETVMVKYHGKPGLINKATAVG
jgi:hypothetical protein